jgi:hypothetical protein
MRDLNMTLEIVSKWRTQLRDLGVVFMMRSILCIEFIHTLFWKVHHSIYFILYVLVRSTIKVSESIIASSPYEFHMLLLITLFMPFVTFDHVARLSFQHLLL